MTPTPTPQRPDFSDAEKIADRIDRITRGASSNYLFSGAGRALPIPQNECISTMDLLIAAAALRHIAAAPAVAPDMGFPISEQNQAVAPASAVGDRNAGIKAAADWVRDRHDAWFAENGYVEPDTNAASFGTGPHANAKEEYDCELTEIEEGIRALAAPSDAQPVSDWELSYHKIHELNKQLIKDIETLHRRYGVEADAQPAQAVTDHKPCPYCGSLVPYQSDALANAQSVCTDERARSAQVEGVGIDEVLANYRDAAADFDAAVLLRFIEKYPAHADALRRYATVQLTSVPATRGEIEAASAGNTAEAVAWIDGADIGFLRDGYATRIVHRTQVLPCMVPLYAKPAQDGAGMRKVMQILDYIDGMEAKQSTKNENAMFIDARAFYGLKSEAIDTRKALAAGRAEVGGE